MGWRDEASRQLDAGQGSLSNLEMSQEQRPEIRDFSPELSESTSLWRYIGLRTLLYMLESERVFIPSISKLREDDPTEGDPRNVPTALFQGISERQQEILRDLAISSEKTHLADRNYPHDFKQE